jgi:transposase
MSSQADKGRKLWESGVMFSRAEIRAVYDHGPAALIALVERFWALIDQQHAQSAEWRARVKALEDQLATQSRTRSKPPSRDSFPTQTRSLRQPSGRKSGGQPGPPGTTLRQVAGPEQTRLHEPVQGMAGGAALAEVAGQPDPERRPVFARPPLQWEVTDQRVLLPACAACGPRQRGILPAGGACGASDGAGGKSVRTYRTQGPRLPCARSGALVADLWAPPVSEGLLEAAVNGCPRALAETATSLTPGLVQAQVVHCAATGRYVAGQRMGRHAASTPQLTHYAGHAQRGATAPQALGLLPAFGGRASHDGFSAYGQ